MNFEAMNFLWVVMALPLGWLWASIRDVRDTVKSNNQDLWKRSNNLAENLTRTEREIRHDFNEISDDLSELRNKAVTEDKVRKIIDVSLQPIRENQQKLEVMVKEVDIKLSQLLIEIAKFGERERIRNES